MGYMNNPDDIFSFTAEGAIPARTLVTLGTADGNVKAAAANTDTLIGVTTEIDAADGDQVDVVTGDLMIVTYGGNVSRGDFLTSDANGHAIAAAPAAGTNVKIIGMALYSGVSGDEVGILASPGQIQG